MPIDLVAMAKQAKKDAIQERRDDEHEPDKSTERQNVKDDNKPKLSAQEIASGMARESAGERSRTRTREEMDQASENKSNKTTTIGTARTKQKVKKTTLVSESKKHNIVNR